MRSVIESLASAKIERGVSIERIICGVYSVSRSGRAVNKERALARQPREWADASSEFVRTSAMLQRIAQSWVADAELADAAAQQHMLRF